MPSPIASSGSTTPLISRIVATWPANFAPRFAKSLGMTADTDFEDIIRAYVAEDMPKR